MDFLNKKTNNLSQEEIGKYRNAHPFPHIHIDNFWDEQELTEILNEIVEIPENKWDNNTYITQINKHGINDINLCPPKVQQIMRIFNSDKMLQYLSKLTGIENLIADPTYTGGGLHRTDKGGKLSIHADFNIHPNLKIWRRVNLLLFLNKDWEDEWGGFLELWEKDMSAVAATIKPIFNRAVIFNITDDAFHGHPDSLNCPENRSRYSLAFYYYTQDRPEDEKAPFHWASWQKRPHGNY